MPSVFPTRDDLMADFGREAIFPIVADGILGSGWVFESELPFLRPHYNASRPDDFRPLCREFGYSLPEDVLVQGTCFNCPERSFVYAPHDASRFSRDELRQMLIELELISSGSC